jgi:manganese efflux pump family protein
VLTAAIKILIVALSLSLDVFAVSVGVGVRGVPKPLRWRIGIAFATAEVSMNLIGAGIGAAAGHLFGDVAGYVGFGALAVLGAFMISESRSKSTAAKLDLSKGWGLFVASLAISLDSLGIGFSILYIGVPIGVALATIAVVSMSATALGLTLGARLGSLAERYAAFVGGLLLMLTGVAFAALKAFHIG